MSQQQSTSRRSVTFAAAFLVVSLGAFAASFYVLDGRALMTPLFETISNYWSDLVGQDPVPAQEDPTPSDVLVLPPEMDEDFALRLWQEQVDSQAIIGRLVRNEVASMSILKVEPRGDDVRMLKVNVKLRDGTKGPGEICMRRFESDWYLAYATGMRSPDATGLVTALRPSSSDTTTTPLPKKEEVDPLLLNTLLVEHRKSQEVIEEYLSGIVNEIVVTDVIDGPGTVTIKLLMKETHGTATAKIVAIRSEKADKPIWFLARFTKTGSDH